MSKRYMVKAVPSLRVRSGPGTGFRQIGSAVTGLEVMELERFAPTAGAPPWIWASPVGGWLRTDYLEPLHVLTPPSGLEGLVAVFGPPGGPQASAGRLRLPAPVRLGWQPTTAQIFACHVRMVPIFEAVFEELYERQLWHTIRTWDGIYNDRLKTGGSGQKSTHAWGVAVDLNAATNRRAPGDQHPELTATFKRHGFVNLTHDPMHYQYVTGY